VKRRLALAILLAAVMSACVEPTKVDGVILQGTTWRALSIAGVSPVLGHEPTLAFQGTGVRGSGGCNDYGGAHAQIEGNTITITNIGMQSNFCEPRESPLMRAEQQFFLALAAATEIHVVDGQLRLSTPMGDLTFEPVIGPGSSVG
jgi:heat shock protein HslJ